MSEPSIVWFDESRAIDASAVGGKFANLARLHGSGIRVPPAFSISTLAYEEVMGRIRKGVDSALSKVDYNDVASLDNASDEIRTMCRFLEMPWEVRQQILAAYQELCKRTNHVRNVPVAVRSSATSEDLNDASLAGQHETFLWVRGEDELLKRIKDCWASAFTARSIKYRHERNLASIAVNMAVIVQRMVQSSVSGVMFTLNPSNGDPSKITVESSWGLGETIASGIVTPDLYIIDKVTLELLQTRANKKAKELAITDDGLRERDVPDERQNTPSLTAEQVLEVAKMGKQIEKIYKTPQDIEWALDSALEFPGNVFILQARPETVWGKKERETALHEGSALDLVVEGLTRRRKIAR